MYKLQNIKIPHKNFLDVPIELYVRSETEKVVF